MLYTAANSNSHRDVGQHIMGGAIEVRHVALGGTSTQGVCKSSIYDYLLTLLAALHQHGRVTGGATE